ncbi:MAG: Ig-like domain-containing protein [Limisphaerales bacterium]
MRTKRLFLFLLACLFVSPLARAQETITNTAPLVALRLLTNAPISEAGLTNAAIFTRETTNLSTNLTVFFSISGTASNGVDYLQLPNHVTIPAGSHTVRLPLVAIDDALPEPTENIILSLLGSTGYRTNSANKISVSVLDNDNQPPVVQLYSPTNQATFVGPTNVLLRAKASDPDGWVRRVEFYRNNVLIGNTTNEVGGSYDFLWMNAQPGTYQLTAKAVDNFELKESSAPINIVIHQATTNFPPVVSILSPTNHSSFLAPAEIFVTAHASDTDGFVQRVDFLVGTNVVGVMTNSGSTSSNIYHFAWREVPAGEYSLRVRATDNGGAMKVSEPVYVKVNPFHAPQPIVSIVATDPEAAEGSSNVLNTATFVISRKENTNVGFTVYYKISGTASNGVDYAWIPSSVYLPPGKLSTNIVIRPIDDTIPEENETVIISLEDPVCIAVYPPPPECYIVGEPRHAVAVIIDNDKITNQPPSVQLVSPTNNSVFVGPVDIPITATASDSDGEIARVDFFAGNQLLGSRTSAPYSMIWSNVGPGFYTITARATDDKGAFRFAEPSKITVRSLTEHAFVHRSMPLWYVPGVKARVQLRAEPRTNTTHYVIHETPPAGWTITLGEHGTINEGKVIFGPFNDGLPRTFVYEVTPPNSATGEKRFAGEGIANGIASPILGAAAMVSAPSHPADNEAADWTMTAKEVEAYGLAWLRCERWPKGPNPIPVNYATRAGFLLESGQTYTVSTHSPTPVPPMLWIPTSSDVSVLSLREEPWTTSNRLATAEASMPTNYTVGVPFTVSIAVNASAAVKAYALEEAIPFGFLVTNITEQGVFCPMTRKVRWGVFLDAEPRTVSYQLIGTTNAPTIARFAGIVSCNGINHPVTGRRGIRRGGVVTLAHHESIKTLSDGNRLMSFSGEPGVAYILEGSADLVDWKPIAELLNSDGKLQYIDSAPNDAIKFYRAVPVLE